VHGLINSVPHFKGKEGGVTPRDLGEILAFGGLGPQPVGSASQVPDVLEKWVNECDIDGFNISRESFFRKVTGELTINSCLQPRQRRRYRRAPCS
jgi:hypothetical protein